LAPQRRDGGRVYFGATRLRVVEIAPREHADAPQPGPRGEVAELVDDIARCDVVAVSHAFAPLAQWSTRWAKQRESLLSNAVWRRCSMGRTGLRRNDPRDRAAQYAAVPAHLGGETP